MRHAITITAALVLAGCGGADPMLLSAPAPDLTAGGRQADPGAPIAVAFRTIEVREVSLPTYAEAEDIYYEGAGGSLMPAASAEWADLPTRAVTLDLVEVLSAVTRARVASEPWPFDLLPEARVEVRATRMAAGVDGLFRLSGLYHVADLRGELDTPRDRSGRFEVAVRYDPEGGVAAIADARSRAVRDLARRIASEGM